MTERSRSERRLTAREYSALRPKFKRGDRVRRVTGYERAWREGARGYVVSVHRSPRHISGSKAKWAFWYGVIYDADVQQLQRRHAMRPLRPFKTWNGYSAQEIELRRDRTKGVFG